MSDLKWTVEKRKVSDLKNLETNPRKITEEAFERLKQRITDRGFHDVVKIDTKNIILSGNQRKRALVELGIEEVFVMVPSRDLTDKERDGIVLESNKNDGTWDMEMLNGHFESDFLFGIGFTEPELAGFGEKPSENKYVHKCPHCSKGIKLSNRVRSLEAVEDDHSPTLP